MADLTTTDAPETQSSTPKKRTRFNAYGAAVTTLHLSVSKTFRLALDREATRQGVSRSALVRQLVSVGLNTVKRRRRLER